MFHWIIPYLVGYNASIPNELNYTMEHSFETEVNLLVMDAVNGISPYKKDYFVNFRCRPTMENLQYCRIHSATMNRSSHVGTVQDIGLNNDVFVIEHDERGIGSVRYSDHRNPRQHNMIRAIVETMNMGFILDNTTVEGDVFQEESIIGTCNTTLSMDKMPGLTADKLCETGIENYELEMPFLSTRLDQETIIVRKHRHLKACTIRRSYFFDDPERVFYSSQKWLEQIFVEPVQVERKKFQRIHCKFRGNKFFSQLSSRLSRTNHCESDNTCQARRHRHHHLMLMHTSL